MRRRVPSEAVDPPSSTLAPSIWRGLRVSAVGVRSHQLRASCLHARYAVRAWHGACFCRGKASSRHAPRHTRSLWPQPYAPAPRFGRYSYTLAAPCTHTASPLLHAPARCVAVTAAATPTHLSGHPSAASRPTRPQRKPWAGAAGHTTPHHTHPSPPWSASPCAPRGASIHRPFRPLWSSVAGTRSAPGCIGGKSWAAPASGPGRFSGRGQRQQQPATRTADSVSRR